MAKQPPQVFRLMVMGGTWRDYSPYSAPGCIQTEWFRSYHKRLKKIGGFKAIGTIPAIVNMDGNAELINQSRMFDAPSYPNVQNKSSVTSPTLGQDYNAPFSANKVFNAPGDNHYLLYQPGVSEARYNPLIQTITENGGYGIVRKSMNIIADGKNTIMSCGDARPDRLGVYPVSGVAYATNTDKNLTMTAFNPLAIPNNLPSCPALPSLPKWTQTLQTAGWFDWITKDGAYLAGGYGADGIGGIFYSTDGNKWIKSTGLGRPCNPVPYYDGDSGNWIASYTDNVGGILYSTDSGKKWQPSTVTGGGGGVHIRSAYGTLAVSYDSQGYIYTTANGGVSYTLGLALANVGGYTSIAKNNTSNNLNYMVVGPSRILLIRSTTQQYIDTTNASGTWVKVVGYGASFLVLGQGTQNGTLRKFTGDGSTTYHWDIATYTVGGAVIILPCVDVAFSDTVIVVTTFTKILYSTDSGLTYSEGTDIATGAVITSGFTTVRYAGAFVAIGANFLWYSKDGSVWQKSDFLTYSTGLYGGASLWLASKLTTPFSVSEGIWSAKNTLDPAQQALPEVADIFTPGEYIWNTDVVNLTTGEETVASATYVIVHPSCGQTQTIDDTTNYYVFIRNLGEMLEAKPAPLRWTSITEPATALKNWLVPMVEGQNINPSDPLTLGNTMNATVKVSGGICAVGPFLFAYGNEGLILNSDVNNPTQWFSLTNQESVYRNSGLANAVNVVPSKVVKGLSYRGQGITYAALFWSLDSLIMATFVGAPAVFNYTVISSAVTILAPHSALEVYGSYYWIGDNRFYVFSGGQISEVPNEQNRNWFFTNINPQRQHLTWASLNTQYNEIWWFFPLGDSEECNHALVYNYSEQIWYDTPINRSAGFYAGVYRAPVWVDSIVDTNYYGYDYYLQEQGTARVDLQGNSTPISCSFVTPDIGFTSSPLPGSPKQSSGLLQNWVQLMRVEPDGLIEGTWTMEVGIKSNPLAQTQYSQDVKTFTNETLEMDVQEQGRMMFLRFSSQDVASSLFMGDMLLTTYLGDAEGV